MARGFTTDIFSANGFVAVCNDYEHAISTVKSSFNGAVFIFPKPFKEQKDLLVEDVEELMESAYLTGEDNRLFIIKSENYSTVVQNKLLKLLGRAAKRRKILSSCRLKSCLVADRPLKT